MYEAAVDYEEEGGIELGNDPLGDDEELEEVVYKALKPDTPPDTPLAPAFVGHYPPLPTQSTTVNNTGYEVASSLAGLSLTGDAESDTSAVVGSSIGSPTAATFPAGSRPCASTRDHASINHGPASHNDSTAHDSNVASTNRELKVWNNRSGTSTYAVLFPDAKPNPAPSEFSISAHDEAMEQEHGINIMRTRFWDPMSSDWNPEKFYDSVMSKYYCPFVCE
jgi:hypothetical protein